jgi:hypothetical protein
VALRNDSLTRGTYDIRCAERQGDRSIKPFIKESVTDQMKSIKLGDRYVYDTFDDDDIVHFERALLRGKFTPRREKPQRQVPIEPECNGVYKPVVRVGRGQILNEYDERCEYLPKEYRAKPPAPNDNEDWQYKRTPKMQESLDDLNARIVRDSYVPEPQLRSEQNYCVPNGEFSISNAAKIMYDQNERDYVPNSRAYIDKLRRAECSRLPKVIPCTRSQSMIDHLSMAKMRKNGIRMNSNGLLLRQINKGY